MDAPEASAVNEIIEILIGVDPGFETVEEHPEISDLKGSLAALCLDDSDTPVAVILLDFPAAVALGSKLMMMPDGQVDEQIAEGQAQEIVLEAASEVCNNLTVPINQVERNPHIRTLPIESAEALMSGQAAFMAAPGARDDYVGTISGTATRISIIRA
ncbi:MAG: hypothetical protein V3W41_15960 [Planctomycetota bacterium]